MREATVTASKVAAVIAQTPTPEDLASKCYHSIKLKQSSNLVLCIRKQQRGGDGQRRQEGLKVEKRDQSKLIKKGNKGQKKISVESLRKGGENRDRGNAKGGKKQLVMSKKGGDKGGKQGGEKRQDKKDRKSGKGGRFGKKGGNRPPKDPQQTAD